MTVPKLYGAVFQRRESRCGCSHSRVVLSRTVQPSHNTLPSCPSAFNGMLCILPLSQFQHCDICLHRCQMAGGAGAGGRGRLCSSYTVAAHGEGRRGQLSPGGSEGVLTYSLSCLSIITCLDDLL